MASALGLAGASRTPLPPDAGRNAPWGAPEDWAEATRAMEHLVHRRRDVLSGARAHARSASEALKRAFPLLDTLCRSTCPWCPEPCCLHAPVYADFRDLLLLALTREGFPPGQLRRRFSDPCRFLTSKGCALPRTQRPWVCTWYLCATQRALLRTRVASGGGALLDDLAWVGRERRQMEEAFVQAVT